jgi:pimeloyl-ACP methyl ester carboxylesterase
MMAGITALGSIGPDRATVGAPRRGLMASRPFLSFASAACSLLVVCSALLALGCATAAPPERDSSDAPVIVFVHGAWGGGWQYRKVQGLLEEKGHRVYRPTLTGLGQRVHLGGPEVGLATHIEDIVKLFEFEELEDVVLVGHSYGGMVITGVAERVPGRIARLVYLDAILPEDGESVLDLFGGGIDEIASIGGDGYEDWQVVPRWVEADAPPPVDVPHPLRSLTEPIRVQSPQARALPASFILTVEAGKDDDAFAVFAERARKRGWPVVVMEGDHNPHWFQPGRFVEVLIATIDQIE